MANPQVVACPVNVWTKVATNVQLGAVHTGNTGARYLQTYRMTGDAAPVGVSEGVPFEGSADIESMGSIDVYVYAGGAAGSVRVDL